MDDDLSPGPDRQLVGSAETLRERCLVPLGAGADEPEDLGEFGPVAERAAQPRRDVGLASIVAEYPWALLERRAMPHVLVVTAGQLGDPVAFCVLVEAGDCSLHGPRPSQ